MEILEKSEKWQRIHFSFPSTLFAYLPRPQMNFALSSFAKATEDRPRGFVIGG